MRKIANRPLCAMLGLLLTSACVPWSTRHAQAPLLPRPVPHPYVVAQTGFGHAAHFVLCVPPACPLVTAKHVAAADMQGEPEIRDSSPANGHAVPSILEPTHVATDILSVYFDSGKAVLDGAARQSIESLAASSSTRKVRITAHTDSTGSFEYNKRLAAQRGAAVSRYIKAMPSLASIVVDVEAKAMCCYVAANADATGRRLNRRVDIAFIDTGQETTR